MRHSKLSRPLSAIALPAAALVLVAAVSGCHWFKKDSGYEQSAETRPLEIPPDLDQPNTEGAMQLPGDAPRSVTRSSLGGGAAASAGTASASGFTVAGERDAVFAKVGDALAAIPGVTIASKAQVLGVYDVSYAGGNFLVRVSKVEAGTYVSAVDPRGLPATGDAPTKLVAALKAALGG
jgi:uncharacterized lipoprotein